MRSREVKKVLKKLYKVAVCNLESLQPGEVAGFRNHTFFKCHIRTFNPALSESYFNPKCLIHTRLTHTHQRISGQLDECMQLSPPLRAEEVVMWH